MDIQSLLNVSFYNNSIKDYLLALVAFFATLGVLWVIKNRVITHMKKLALKTKTHVDDIVIGILDTVNWVFYVYLSFYIGTRFLVIRPPIVDRILFFFLLVVIVYYSGRAFQSLIDHLINIHVEKKKTAGQASVVRFFGLVFKIGIWTVAILVVLSNLGIQITPLIAGLGVGGVAIAFALQNILEDLFSSISIYLDKPFKEGDFVVIGNDMGTIKHIGLKTTRIEALQGQEIVVSNRELTSVRINNYKQMKKRRIAFSLGVEYGTKYEKLKKVSEIIRKIISDVEHAEFDRAHFKEFGDFALIYEVVYYVDVPDYNVYMDVQQAINLGIKKAFEKEGIEFAYPTQTIYLRK
jgi:small-conductance mechanosensitive channel